MKSLAIFILFNLLAIPVFAQYFNFKFYSLDEGLPQSEVFMIYQDTRGSIWSGTNGGGLARFNGKTFEVFTTKDGLFNNQVNGLKEDSKGYLWISTFDGVSKFDGKRFINYKVDKDSPNIVVGRFYEGHEGKIYFYAFHNGAGNAIYVLEEKDSIFRDLGKKFPDLLPKGSMLINGSQLANKNLLINTQNGVLEYDGKNLVRTQISDHPEFAGRRIGVRMVMKDGRLLLTSFAPNTPVRIYFYKNGKITEVASSGFGIAQSIHKDSEEQVWFSIGNNIFLIDNKGVFHQFPTSAAISAITVDRENNVWIGTRGYGMGCLANRRFMQYDERMGLQNLITRSFHQDEDGKMWIGVIGQLVEVLPNGQAVVYPVENYPNVRVTEIKRVKGKLWVFTDAGIFELEDKKLKPINKKMGFPEAIPINMMVEQGDTAWFISNRGGLFMKTPKEVKQFNSPQDFPDNSFHHLYKAKNGTIWLTSENGIMQYDGQKFSVFSQKDGIKNNVILQCTEDHLGRLWFTTYGEGLYIYDGKTFENIRVETHKLTSNLIYSILNDQAGNMWIGTQKGIDKITIDEKGKIKKVRNYGKSEGFLVPECNGRAIFQDKDKGIWVGTLEGAFRYDPLEDRPNTLEPATRIGKIRLFFRSIDWQNPDYQAFHKGMGLFESLPKNLILPYDSNHLSFDFEANSFQAPEKVLFQWKLEGIDKDWLPPTSKTEAAYPNLPAGNYTFKVRAANNEGVWNEKPVEFSFRIEPPFWETWWFRSGMFFGLIGVVFTGFRWRIHLIKAKQAELERLVKEKTAEVVQQKNQILEKNAELQQTQEEIITQHDFINRQNKELQKKNKDIIDSINYAKRIQEAMLPNAAYVRQFLPDSFIFFRPRDIVSGDFYWFSVMGRNSGNVQKLIGESCDISEFNASACRMFIAVADCTGHGVPGAFMSMMGDAYLNQIVEIQEISEPAEVLNLLHQNIRKALHQEQSSNHDGMEVGLCVIDLAEKTLTFAGARSPLIMVRNGQLEQIKGDKKSIGGNLIESNKDFTQQVIPLTSDPTMFYLFSDGYRDQIGGFQRRKFLSLRFQELLFEIHSKPVEEQYAILEEKLEEWKGKNRQIDDILLMGFRL